MTASLSAMENVGEGDQGGTRGTVNGGVSGASALQSSRQRHSAERGGALDSRSASARCGPQGQWPGEKAPALAPGLTAGGRGRAAPHTGPRRTLQLHMCTTHTALHKRIYTGEPTAGMRLLNENGNRGGRAVSARVKRRRATTRVGACVRADSSAICGGALDSRCGSSGVASGGANGWARRLPLAPGSSTTGGKG
jgi:hypothetical protein